MSSILDALQKIERAAPPGIHTRPAPRDRRGPRRLTLGGLLVAFVAGAGVTASLYARRPASAPHEVALGPAADGTRAATPAPARAGRADSSPGSRPPHVARRAPAPAPAATPGTLVAPAPPVTAPETPKAAAASGAPAAVASAPATAAVSPATAPPPAAAPPPTVAAAPSPAGAAASALPLAAPAPPLPPDAAPVGRVALGAPAPAARPESAVAPPPTVAPPAAAAPAVAARPRAPRAPDLVVPRPPADAPRIQVSFLVYSRVPERRSVTLTIDGGGLTTLHEGESADGVEVARIFPDHVELRHAGKSFVLVPRD
ncbi:MAG TPA: hypothetical protein VFD84_20020 [Candidatus Binatia bacterium]|nr:hypothetical protein [Candidatus Binatia bacterium]